MKEDRNLIENLTDHLIEIISETNGITLNDTLELLCHSEKLIKNLKAHQLVKDFQELLLLFRDGKASISKLIKHPVSLAFSNFFKAFPKRFHEEHIHLTGSLSAEFIFPRLKQLLEGPNHKIYEEKIRSVYGAGSLPINSPSELQKLIQVKEGEQFSEYLKILFLPKLILNSREVHKEAAYHMAQKLWNEFNIGKFRLKFTLSRSSSLEEEEIPGHSGLSTEDIIMGLYEGLMQFKEENPEFSFILSPSFRKEKSFYDARNFSDKENHFSHLINEIIKLLDKYPFLSDYLCDIDTVGDEKELFRKRHFAEMKEGLRKLQYKGLKIRSHHGETWNTLRQGIQSVDNAMNIWHIDALEHGLSLGINPNFYFHRLYQRIIKWNSEGRPLIRGGQEYLELEDMQWASASPEIKDKLIHGHPLTEEENVIFLKAKFHTAREIEHYQHDVLNRIINKHVTLTALPTSNLKLTDKFPHYKDHPFSWWEKKGVKLGIGTDNYITLNTNFIQEMLILLYSDAENLKITKLLMIASREERRPFMSHLLWEMRKKIKND